MQRVISILLIIISVKAQAYPTIPAQSARLYLNTLHSEIEKFNLKKKDFYEVTISDNNSSLMEIKRCAILKELNHSIFKLNKTRPYPNNEPLLINYKNEFDSLVSICETEMKAVITLKKYISCSPQDLQRYFDVLNQTEYKLNEVEHRIAESENQFFKINQIKGQFPFKVYTSNDTFYELNREIRTIKLRVIFLDNTIEDNLAPLRNDAEDNHQTLAFHTEQTKQAIEELFQLVSTLKNENLQKLVHNYLEDIEDTYLKRLKKANENLKEEYTPTLLHNTNIDLHYIQLDYQNYAQKFNKKLILFHMHGLEKMQIF